MPSHTGVGTAMLLGMSVAHGETDFGSVGSVLRDCKDGEYCCSTAVEFAGFGGFTGLI